MAAIPPHNLTGVLPPFVGADAASPRHSPYRAPLSEFVDRFATSSRRIDILKGFFDLRRELKGLGITTGFQWLDGSFTEQISREPNDLDLVTIFRRPASWKDPAIFATIEARTDLFDPFQSKQRYLCDAYYLDMEPLNIQALVYWYGLFGHRRGTSEWKGLIQVDLAEDEQAAMDLLAKKVVP